MTWTAGRPWASYRTSLRVSSQILQSKGLIILVHLSPRDECEVSAVETDTSGNVVTTQWVFLGFELDNLHFSFSLSSEHPQEKSAAWVGPDSSGSLNSSTTIIILELLWAKGIAENIPAWGEIMDKTLDGYRNALKIFHQNWEITLQSSAWFHNKNCSDPWGEQLV